MTIQLYTDVHVSLPIVLGLRRRGVAVLTAQEDGTATLADPDLLDRATSLGRVLFSQDEDLLIEAARRQQVGQGFSGLRDKLANGQPLLMSVNELEMIAKTCDPPDLENQVIYVPLS